MLKTGELVRAYRLRAKREQAELAEILQVSALTFSLKERGITQFKADEIKILSKELGVEPGELIGE